MKLSFRTFKSRTRLALSVFFLASLLFSCFGTTTLTKTAAASTCTTVQYGSFFKDAAFAVAEKEGLFTKEGLCVQYDQVSSSTQQFNDFLAGNYDIIATALDNVANRIVNSNLPISMIAASDQGADFVLAINTANGIHSIADLKGKAIAVDAPNSGFVFALRKILAANGLYYENGDYTFQVIGGTSARYSAIEAGSYNGQPVYATMLIYPFTAKVYGDVQVAARFSDYDAPYQVNGLAVTHDTANNKGAMLTAFTKAYIEADRFLFDSANHDQVVADLEAEYSVSQSVAEEDYQAAINSVSGQNVDAKMNKKGEEEVINVRTEFGGFNTTVDAKKFVKPAPGGFYDDRFWKAAEQQVNAQSGDDGNGGDD